MRDITIRELATVVPLLGLSLFLGFYPKPVLDRLQPAVHDLVVHVQQSTGSHAPVATTGGATP
jgi:NADH-quinone oxidoreductase subunit M